MKMVFYQAVTFLQRFGVGSREPFLSSSREFIGARYLLPAHSYLGARDDENVSADFRHIIRISRILYAETFTCYFLLRKSAVRFWKCVFLLCWVENFGKRSASLPWPQIACMQICWCFGKFGLGHLYLSVVVIPTSKCWWPVWCSWICGQARSSLQF